MFSKINDDVYKRLESAVLEIFSQSDFHKASVRAIAKHAGISFSTIYKNFDSKEDLLFAYIDIWLGDLTDRIVDHLQGIKDLKEKLRKVFWIQLDYYEKNPKFGRILFMTLPMQTWMGNKSFHQKKMVSLFLDVIKKGQEEGALDPNVRAGVMLDFMLGLVQRAFFMWMSRGQKESLSDSADQYFKMVWRSISKPDVPYGF